MKHIKLFEELNIDKLKIGDWVLCEDDSLDHNDFLGEFISNNVGKFIRRRNGDDRHIDGADDKYKYMIQYYNIPDELEEDFLHGLEEDDDCRVMSKKEILYWSNNKEDFEYIIAGNKYNL